MYRACLLSGSTRLIVFGVIVQNGLGIVLAGALAGAVYLQKQEKEEVKGELDEKLSGERKVVSELKSQVRSVSLFSHF